jgi:PilX N-terminal
VRAEKENGIALVTVLLVLILISALVAGMSWMVMTDQRLGGNNQDREKAFYGAEAGMEKLTTDVGNIFASKGSLSAADIVAVTAAPPGTLPGITYLNALGASTYQITCPPVSPCVPTATNAQILAPSPYSGMWGLITPFTMTVAAQTSSGAEVKLQRQVQAVAIPVFQFGIFCNNDCAFFNGPPFDFGGRVHTNGNLWLSPNSGPLFLADRVTVSGEVIRTNLENGWPGGGATIGAGGNYSGNVSIALVPNPAALPAGPPYTNAQWRELALTESSVPGPNIFGGVNPPPDTAVWTGTVLPAYAGMLQNHVATLNLASSTLGGITQPIALIERPTKGEAAANPAEFNQRLFSQASLRILVDDYPAGSPGPGAPAACNGAEMLSLDTVTPTVPIDLATLAYNGAPPPAEAWYTAGGPVYPLPLSNAGAADYVGYTGTAGVSDGYWQTNGTPIITGCIKIEYQTVGNVWTDVTQEILELGLTGRNIYPETNVGAVNQLLLLPNTGTVAGAENATCGGATSASEPTPNAVIRLARLRDNPSTAYPPTSNACVVTTSGYDYWPMVIYDTREAISRDNALPDPGTDPDDGPGITNRPPITTQGVVNYVELDVSNLSRWFTGAIGASGAGANNVGGYAIYFSDRRGNQKDPVTNLKTGSFGFNDVINLTDPGNGCPNGVIDQGEDFAGDGVLRTYGGVPLLPIDQGASPNLAIHGLLPALQAALGPVLSSNPNCAAAVAAPSPNYIYTHDQEARENPPAFFRRALKIEYGQTINLGTTCYGAAPNPPCGLTIVSENPVYIEGEYNDGGVNNGTWAGASVASSVAADSVTLLSNQWNDVNSFISPYSPGSRGGVSTSYRVAIIAGKGIPFPQPANTPLDYGTDGGVHNFLRYLEGWGGTLWYNGSLVSFYFNAQAIGPYKCCTTVYTPPNRQYTFDQNFTLGPQWLPPRTPTLRAINTIGFTQEVMPTQ